MGKVEDEILEVLKKSGTSMTLVQIAEQLGKPPKKIFRPLRKLFEAGKVDCNNQSRTYKLVDE